MKKIITVVCLLCLASTGLAEEPQWVNLENIFGRKGIVQDDMFKVTFPRTDLNIKIGNTRVEPGLGLTSWIGFKKNGEKAIMMGDLVLTAAETTPVMQKIISENIEVTALHNHLFGTDRELMYLHFSGFGLPDELAKAMKNVLISTATPMGSQPGSAEEKKPLTEFATIQTVLGEGQQKGKILQYSFPREEKVTENGMDVPPFLGTANAVNFETVMGGKTATTGDFVLIAEEVNRVIKALTETGITVTAVHNHMLGESPRLFFLHFWGEGKPEAVAKGIKSALNKVKLAHPFQK